MSQPIWETPAGSIGVFTENDVLNFQFVAYSELGNTIQYVLLNGAFPKSTTVSITLSLSGVLSGIPDEVEETTVSEFTIRAFEYSTTGSVLGFRDRTFSITVEGVTAPQLTTPSGLILTSQDSVWVNYQLTYTNPDPNSTSTLSVVLGSLPPGLEMNSSGLIRGYAKPPVDSSNNPINYLYTFTVQLDSESGTARENYDILIINQETIPGFTGRIPVIYNIFPPSFVISSDDPYAPYYTNSSNIGTFTDDNNFNFKIIGHDFEDDSLTYQMSGLSSFGMTYNSSNGWIAGTFPDIGEDVNTYTFTVRVFKTSNPTKTSPTYTMTVTVLGDLLLGIDWITPSDLGQIINGQVCDKSVLAVSKQSVPLKYRIIAPATNALPPNLSLTDKGEIQGRLAFQSSTSLQIQGNTLSYTFIVEAYSDTFSEITSTKEFTLTTYQLFEEPYENLYIKAMFSDADRAKLDSLLSDDFIIPTELVYRPDDVYFGKAKSVIYQHAFGIPTATVDAYISAVNINHYWKNVTLGEIKTAVARDENNNIIYEVVYSEVIDNLVNANGVSVSKEITWPRIIPMNLNDYITSSLILYSSFTYYDLNSQVRAVKDSVTSSTVIPLNTVDGLVVGMNLVGSGITNDAESAPPKIESIYVGTGVGDPSTVTVNVTQTLNAGTLIIFSDLAATSLTPGQITTLNPNSLINMRQQINTVIGESDRVEVLPLWMRSQQLNGNTLGYVPAWVICYTKPGNSEFVADNIRTLWNHTLNELNFELEKFEIDKSMTYDYDSSTETWASLPSAQPAVTNDSKDVYIYYPRKTILPTVSQE
jgi:hypothetical protein